MWTLQQLGKLSALMPILLRLMVGIPFAFFHGYDKIAPGGKLDGGKAFVDMAAPLAPDLLLYVGAWLEFLGGLAVLAGMFTRWAAIGILAVMVYAIFGVHWAQGFPMRVEGGNPAGYEPAAAYAVLCLALMASGPGSLSLDRLFFGKAALNG